MARLPLVDLEYAPGIMTEQTERGAKGRYFDCDKVRFRQLLPEKLGGWDIVSLGTTNGDPDPGLTQQRVASATYGAGASSVSLTTAVTCADQDPVWLFGDTKTSGIGNRVLEATVPAGSQLFNTTTTFTALAGDALLIRLNAEFSGGATVIAGGTQDSNMLTLGSTVNTYLAAGSIVVIQLLGGGTHFTELRNNLVAGATQITLQEPLPDAVAAGTPVNIYGRGASFIDQPNEQSWIIRFFAYDVTASTVITTTVGVPENVGGADIDVRAFQQTACDGAQTGVTTLNITPVTAFAITTTATFPDGLVILPSFVQEQSRFLGFARALHDWTDLEAQNWLAIGTDVKLYLVNNNTLFDITPLRDSGVLTNPFTTTAQSAVVNVNHAAHGGQVGNYVRFTGAAAVGGLTLNGEFQIATVVDADNYTVTATVPAESTAGPGGGAVSYEYDIDIGASGNVTVTGWGTGGYGQGLYGIGQVGVGVVEPVRIWSLDNFGEDLLASPSGGPLYHWDRTNGATTRAVIVPTAPPNMQRMLISPEARHTIAFGAGLGTQSAPGNKDALLIRFSSQEDFTDWTSTDVNTAGDIRLDVGSRIITAIESRGQIIVFTDESLHGLQFVGGNFLFSLIHAGQSVTIIGPNGGVDVNGIVYFMGTDDFLMYDGVLRVMECDVRNTVFEDINQAQGDKVFCAVNKLFTEIWWLYPSSTSEIVNRYVKYNYKDQVWDFGTIDRTALHDSSSFFGLPYGTFEGRIFQHESGVDETDIDGVTQPMVSFLETYQQEIAEGTRLMHVGGMIPDFKTLVGSIDLTLRGRAYPQQPNNQEVTKGPYTITSTTEKQDFRMRARQISFRVESNNIGDDWRMGTWRAKVRPHGRRGQT